MTNYPCTSNRSHGHGQRTITLPRMTSLGHYTGSTPQKYTYSHPTGASAALRQLPGSWLQNFESLGRLHAAARHPCASGVQTALPSKRWSASLARAPLLWLHRPVLPLLLRTPTEISPPLNFTGVFENLLCTAGGEGAILPMLRLV